MKNTHDQQALMILRHTLSTADKLDVVLEYTKFQDKSVKVSTGCPKDWQDAANDIGVNPDNYCWVSDVSNTSGGPIAISEMINFIVLHTAEKQK